MTDAKQAVAHPLADLPGLAVITDRLGNLPGQRFMRRSRHAK
jgi:hypothetical protein